MTAIPIQSSARWRRDGQLLRGAKSMGTEHLAELSTKLSGCGAQSPTLQHSMVVLCDTSATSVKLSNTPLLQIPGSLRRPTTQSSSASRPVGLRETGCERHYICGVFPHQSFADDGCAAPSTRGSKNKVRRRGHCIKALAARPPTSMQLTRRRALCRACFHAVRPTRA
jgi:hypothetical protein